MLEEVKRQLELSGGRGENKATAEAKTTAENLAAPE
jgi:hypothetical protein